MFKKINAREKLVGWYHSGPKLRASDLEINELLKKYTPNPLLVIVDVQPKEVGVPTDAYFAVDEIKDVSFLSFIFILFYFIYLFIYFILFFFFFFFFCDANGNRTELPRREHLFTSPQPSKPRKRKKSAWNIYFGTSATSL